MRFQRRTVGMVALVMLVAVFGWRVVLGRRRQHAAPEKETTQQKHEKTPSAAASGPATPDCSIQLTKDELLKSLDLGTSFMVAHQKPAGNFDYEYDWKTKTNSADDNAVRQAGALWGLALLNGHAGDKSPPELKAALAKGIAYFDDVSRTTMGGGRYPVYRGDGDAGIAVKDGIGVAALVTLALVDYVRSIPASDDATKKKWTARANEYVSFLATSVRKDGRFPGEYQYDTGTGVGKPSPYSDGEALLALTEAMKYLPRPDLRPVIEKAAAGSHKINVDDAIEKEPDSDTTKGYYQWSSMAFYELATSPMADAGPYGDWLLALSDWVLDVHKVLSKPRNTGYAYEGLVSAYAWAKEKKDPRAERLKCAINQGLAHLMSWQVGHPRASALGTTDDPKAIGGVQNHATEPAERIDVVQHQMHATMLAVDHLFD